MNQNTYGKGYVSGIMDIEFNKQKVKTIIEWYCIDPWFCEMLMYSKNSYGKRHCKKCIRLIDSITPL